MAGLPAAFDAELAADGVSEFLDAIPRGWITGIDTARSDQLSPDDVTLVAIVASP
jgi:hypothetical protein